MQDLVGKRICVNSYYSGQLVKGYIYHVDYEQNLALAFWNNKAWEDKVSLTVLEEWLDNKWCYLTESTGV